MFTIYGISITDYDKVRHG